MKNYIIIWDYYYINADAENSDVDIISNMSHNWFGTANNFSYVRTKCNCIHSFIVVCM